MNKHNNIAMAVAAAMIHAGCSTTSHIPVYDQFFI